MTTLAITTLCDGDTDLLPFWIEHYRSLGVDRFILCVDHDGCPGVFVNNVKGANVWYYQSEGGQGERRDAEEREAIDFEMSGSTPPDWILYTDLDEHQEYQGGLHAALAKADAAGDEIVMGVLCDRLAADGSFPELPARLEGVEYDRETGLAMVADPRTGGKVPATTLDATFPLRANLNRDVLKIRYCKVMAAKPGVILRPGRHGTQEHAFAAKRPGILSDGHLVHHFKWRAGIIERIKRRMKELPPEYDWYRTKYEPFVAEVEANGGRIPSEYLK